MIFGWNSVYIYHNKNNIGPDSELVMGVNLDWEYCKHEMRY